jgi:hypothetical protein
MSKTYHFDITTKQIKAHICDFEQNSDGSIYIKFPEFEFSKWIGPDSTSRQLIPYDSPGKGKLSIHGSGISHVKTFDNNSKAEFQVLGSPLLSKDGKTAGIRHLATIFPKEPVIETVESTLFKPDNIKPMVFVFFAVPFGLDISFQGSFSMDEYEPIPPIIGVGNQALRMHNIFWFSYSSKYMDNWPLATHVHFSDGFVCPLFVGVATYQIRIDIRNPQYSINGKSVQISI